MGEDGRQRRPFHVPVVRRRWPQLGIAAACAVVLVVAAYFVVTTTSGCASGLHRTGPLDECIGVTDGPGEFGLSDGRGGFDGSLRVVQDKIAAENARVRRISREQNKPYVSIAYFSPLTVAKPDTTTIEAVRRGLEGTYVSQLRANADGREEWGGNLPLIQVLLANPGSRSAQWEPVVEQLRQLAEPEENGRLVAVTGLGQSLAGTRDAINRLSQHRIPMVGAISPPTSSRPIRRRPRRRGCCGWRRRTPRRPARWSGAWRRRSSRWSSGTATRTRSSPGTWRTRTRPRTSSAAGSWCAASRSTPRSWPPPTPSRRWCRTSA
ncbi:hypothetical protein ACWEV3_00575 [Saccharopolyspora sp. NPDC003752]